MRMEPILYKVVDMLLDIRKKRARMGELPTSRRYSRPGQDNKILRYVEWLPLNTLNTNNVTG